MPHPSEIAFFWLQKLDSISILELFGLTHTFNVSHTNCLCEMSNSIYALHLIHSSLTQFGAPVMEQSLLVHRLSRSVHNLLPSPPTPPPQNCAKIIFKMTIFRKILRIVQK